MVNIGLKSRDKIISIIPLLPAASELITITGAFPLGESV